ncbi:MAG: C-GCAxxG-C-C family protein [Candidatus Thermoplasmatota archaeon]
MNSEQKKMCDKAYDLAFKYEAERGSCPQCVLAALMETVDVGDPVLVKAGDALAGGTVLSSEGTCGALAGGLMCISSAVGRSYEDFSEGRKKRRVFQFAKKLYDRFIEEYDSILCKDVQKKLFGRSYNLMDKEEYQAFEDAGAHVDKCPKVSGNVAKWTAEIILEELKR